MTISELRAKRAAVQGEIDAILAKDELTQEERDQSDTLEASFDELGAQIVAQEAKLAADGERRTRNSARQATLNASAGRRSQPNSGTQATQIGAVKESFEEDPRKGFKTPREFMSAVIDAGRNSHLDNRLQFLAAAGSDEARGNSDPSGGFLIPEGFSPNLLKIDPEMDPMAGRVQDFPMQLPVVKVPARTDKDHTTSVSGGLTVTRRPETVSGSSSQMTLERVVMTAHELFGLSYATEEMLTDSPISFAALLAAGFSDQFVAQLIKERLTGTGVGEYLGVLNAPCTVSIAKETGQAAATIVYNNVLSMMARCWRYDQAIWLANHDCLLQLSLLNQPIGVGGVPVWQPSAREGTPGVLMGRPIFFTEYTKTCGTVGDLVLANWSQYLEGVYQPLQSAESIHVRFINHERTFKFWVRNAGQPWWRAALTPQNSTATLSPFVTLATRA